MGQIHRLQQFIDRFGTHARVEVIAVLFDGIQIRLFREQLAALEIGHTGLDHHIGLEIKNAFDLAQGHVEQQAHSRGQRLQIPDVRDRTRQFDMAHALATDLGQRHFNAALLTYHAAMLQALVLAAQALVVLDRPKDLGAEQTVSFRLESAVVDGLRLFDFAVGPRTNLLRRRQADADGVEIFNLPLGLQQIK